MARLNKAKPSMRSRGAKQQQLQAISKDKVIVRTIIRVFLIGGVIVGLLVGMLTFLQSLQATKQQEIKPLKGQLSEMQSKASVLMEQLNSLGEAAKIYSSLSQRRSNMQFMIDPLAIRPLMAALKAKYHLSTLNLEVKAQEDLPIVNASEASPKAVRYEVVMNIGSISDHFIYHFLYDLLVQFPGFVQVQGLEVVRKQPISIDVLTKVSRGLNAETTTAEVSFFWYGYSAIEKEAKQIKGDG